MFLHFDKIIYDIKEANKKYASQYKISMTVNIKVRLLRFYIMSEIFAQAPYSLFKNKREKEMKAFIIVNIKEKFVYREFFYFFLIIKLTTSYFLQEILLKK